MTWFRIFYEAPHSWGLRGDPYLWDALAWHLSETKPDVRHQGADQVETAIWAGLTALCGTDLRRKTSDLTLVWLPQGGMSGGRIDCRTWTERLVPLLVARSNELNAPACSTSDYHPAEHRFRFAAWAAATAARSSRRICTFSVRDGALLLRASPLKFLALGPHWLPSEQSFDEVHRGWCEGLLSQRGAPSGLTHGVAAKLVNVYTKSLFHSELDGSWFQPHQAGCRQDPDAFRARCEALHPPVDRELLNGLVKDNVGGLVRDWARLRDEGWSNFGPELYAEAIRLMKSVTDNRPWRIESYWRGFRS